MRFFQLSGCCLLFSAAVVASDRQFTVTECATLEAQREAVKAKMRSGYDVSDYNRLTGRELKLFNLLARHCQKPERDDYLLEEPRSRQPSTQSSDELAESFPMMRADNAVFVGEQAKAWDIYYQMPDECRLHRQTRQDFVYCAEDKKRQRDAFLQNWQATQQLKEQSKASVDDPAVAAVRPVRSKVAEVLLPEHNTKLQASVAVASPPVRQMVPLDIQAKTPFSEQLSFIWIGALLVFCWMSWLLWRR